MGGDKSSWESNEPTTYTAYDNEGKLIGTYNTQLQADQAEEKHYDDLRSQWQLPRDDDPPPPPPRKKQPGKKTELGIFGKIFTFLGCAVLLVVGIFVALWIFGWVIATFVVK